MARTFKDYYYNIDEGLAGDIGRQFGRVAGRAVQGMADFKNQAVAGYRDVRPAAPKPDATPSAPSKPAPMTSAERWAATGGRPTHADSFSSSFADPTSPMSQFAGILKDIQRDADEGRSGGLRTFSPIQLKGKGKDGKPYHFILQIKALTPVIPTG